MLQRVLSEMPKEAKRVLPNNFTYSRVKKEFIFSRAVDVQQFIVYSKTGLYRCQGQCED